MPSGSIWILLLTIIILIMLKVGKSQSLALAKKIAESDRWPFDEWEMSKMGLGYASRLGRDEVIRRCKISALVIDILFWCVSVITIFLLYIWLT